MPYPAMQGLALALHSIETAALAALIVLANKQRRFANFPLFLVAGHPSKDATDRFQQRRKRLFLTAWIVARIHVVELQGRCAVDLDHHFSAGHRIVMRVRVEISETTGRESSHLALLKAISHPDLESP